MARTMAGTELFRTSFVGGYNKSDVMEYVKKLEGELEHLRTVKEKAAALEKSVSELLEQQSKEKQTSGQAEKPEGGGLPEVAPEGGPEGAEDHLVELVVDQILHDRIEGGCRGADGHDGQAGEAEENVANDHVGQLAERAHQRAVGVEQLHCAPPRP